MIRIWLARRFPPFKKKILIIGVSVYSDVLSESAHAGVGAGLEQSPDILTEN